MTIPQNCHVRNCLVKQLRHKLHDFLISFNGILEINDTGYFGVLFFGAVFPRIRGTRCNIIQPCQRLFAVNYFKIIFPLIAQTEKFPETAFTQVVI